MDKIELIGNLALAKLFLLSKSDIILVDLDTKNKNHLGILYLISLLQNYAFSPIKVELNNSLWKLIEKDSNPLLSRTKKIKFETLVKELSEIAEDENIYQKIWENFSK